MPTFYNHAHFPVSEYQSHSPEKYRDMVENGGLHSGRALACSLPGDIVQLHPRLRKSYEGYLEGHLATTGLAIGKVIFDADPATFKNYPEHDLSVYGFNPSIHEMKPDDAWVDTARKCNNKNWFISWCGKLGLPIPRTYVTSHGPVHDLADLRLPVLVKPARSSAGVGIKEFGTQKGLAAYLDEIDGKFEYQVQEKIDGTFFSEQYRATNDQVRHVASTGLLSDNKFKYQGNFIPSSHNGRKTGDYVAESLQSMGLKGPFGLDMTTSSEGEKHIEGNARWTGAGYPAEIGNRLDARAWLACILPTDHDRLEDIRIDDLVYNPTTRIGAIIINAGQLSTEGNLTFQIIGDPETQTGIQSELQKRLMR